MITPRIYPAVRHSLIDIWRYTDDRWGENKANQYIRDLYTAIEKVAHWRSIWQPAEDKETEGIYFIKVTVFSFVSYLMEILA